MTDELDCVVIGGGVAGLAAALVLGRARRTTLVLDRNGQSNRSAEHIGGLLGHDGIAPDEFYARARDQVTAHETVEVRDAEVTDVRPDGDAFEVVLDGGEQLRARAIVLATGMDYAMPDVPGFREHWGRSVFHCPYCHGWEVRDRRVVVLGQGEVAEMKSQLLRAWTDDVTLVDPDDVVGLRSEDGVVQAIVRHDGSEVACDAVLAHAPLSLRGPLAERLGLELTGSGLVAIDAMGRTSVPGVYAAGDVAVAPQQVAIALGSGHLAGATVVRELVLGRDPVPAR